MKNARMFVNLVCVVVLSSTVFGAFVIPPTDFQTYQLWTFDNYGNGETYVNISGVKVDADVDDNPYGDSAPIAVMTVKDPACGADPGWYANFLNRTGVWASELTTATLTIPNTGNNDPDSYKDIWLRMGFRTEVVESTILNAVVSDLVSIEKEYTITPTRNNAGYLDGWYELCVHWRIAPNPPEETIFLSVKDSGADIDYIEVWTNCVPEPATLMMLAFGSLFFTGCKK